jgi:hypothetical protein
LVFFFFFFFPGSPLGSTDSLENVADRTRFWFGH